MTRTSFGFTDMLRTIASMAIVFALFVGSVHVASNGLATPAIASTEDGLLESVARKTSGGAGFVLMVSLQRAR